MSTRELDVTIRSMVAHYLLLVFLFYGFLHYIWVSSVAPSWTDDGDVDDVPVTLAP
jgi:hypothetical protein